MTRKHYIQLAQMLQDRHENNYRCYGPVERKIADAVLDEITNGIADICARDNPNFKWDKFMIASVMGKEEENCKPQTMQSWLNGRSC